MTGLFINQYIGSALVTVAGVDRPNLLGSTIQKLVKEEKDPDLDLKISNPEKKDLIIPFEKKKSAADCPPVKLTFYNTTTKQK